MTTEGSVGESPDSNQQGTRYISKIPKGMTAVYILWCPPQYRSESVREKYPVVNGLLEFYVGFGKMYRPYGHLYETAENTGNPHKVRIITAMKQDGLEPTITIAMLTPDEAQAKRGERFLISLLGRRDVGTGPLTNKTAGGDGGSCGPETRAKMSRSHRERAKTEEGQRELLRFRAAAQTPEAREKHARSVSVAGKERMKTEEGQATMRKMWELQRTPEAMAKRSRSLCVAQKRRMQTERGREHQRKMTEAARKPEVLLKSAALLRVVSLSEAERIRQRIEAGERVSTLAREYGVCTETIYNIRHHKNGY